MDKLKQKKGKLAYEFKGGLGGFIRTRVINPTQVNKHGDSICVEWNDDKGAVSGKAPFFWEMKQWEALVLIQALTSAILMSKQKRISHIINKQALKQNGN